MENASKALIMAGAMLLALIVTSLLVYVFSQPGQMFSSINDREEAKKLKEFNAQYEVFNKNLYGVDIISAINRVFDNNRQNESNINKIVIEVIIEKCVKTNEFGMEEEILRFMRDTGDRKTYTNFTNLDFIDSVDTNININRKINGLDTEDLRTFKQAKFVCTGIEYSTDTGRVSKISFKNVLKW